MKISCRLGMLAVFLLAPSIAAADEPGWYLGAGLGLSQASGVPLYTQTSQLADFTRYSSSSSDEGSVVERLEGGYWGSANIGLQFSYVDLGHYTHLAHGREFEDCQLCGSFGFIESARVKAQGESVSLAARWPLPDDFDLIVHGGFFVNQVTYADNLANPFDENPFPGRKNDVGLGFGAGLGWNFAAHWEALLGLDEYPGIGDSDSGTFSVTVLSLGIQYHF